MKINRLWALVLVAPLICCSRPAPAWERCRAAGPRNPKRETMVVLRNSKVEWVVATAFVAAAVLTTAPALAAERPVAGTCFMGECSRYYIVSLDPAMAGSVSVRVRIEHYCTPGDPPDMTAKRCADWRANVGPDWEPLDALYGVKCPPRGWIYYDGNYLAMPQPEVGHATLINAQIWAAVCHRPYPEGWPRPQ